MSGAREQLIGSAKQLMAERGFTAVGINEICERAGVKKGSFYYFFPSKRDLAIEAIDSHWQDHDERLARTLEGDAPPLERI
ncbi:MAG: helix-turn-helix domain-containing protein, partial [Acidobacteriota bacterium]